MSQKRSIGKCYGCEQEEELVTHQKTSEFPGGDPDKPLCAKCNMRVRKVSAKANQCRQINAATQAMLSIDAVIAAAPDEDRPRFRNMQDQLMATINSWSASILALGPSRHVTATLAENPRPTPKVSPQASRLGDLGVGSFFELSVAGKDGSASLHQYIRTKTNGNVMAKMWNGNDWSSEQMLPQNTNVTGLTEAEAKNSYPAACALAMSTESKSAAKDRESKDQSASATA
jgi:hypothetical protein